MENREEKIIEYINFAIDTRKFLEPYYDIINSEAPIFRIFDRLYEMIERILGIHSASDFILDFVYGDYMMDMENNLIDTPEKLVQYIQDDEPIEDKRQLTIDYINLEMENDKIMKVYDELLLNDDNPLYNCIYEVQFFLLDLIGIEHRGEFTDYDYIMEYMSYVKGYASPLKDKNGNQITEIEYFVDCLLKKEVDF